MEFIRDVDILGEVFFFTIFGKSTYNTFFGGLLTLLIILFTFVTSIFFGMDLITRTNPTVIMERDVPEKYSYINCNLTNFPLFWRLKDDYDVTFDFSKVFYPELNLYVHKFNPETGVYDLLEIKKMSIKNCTRDLVQNDYLYDMYGLNQFFCVDFSETGVPLGGFWDSGDMVYYFEKVFYTCPNDNKTSQNCTNQHFIKKLLGSSQKIFYEIIYPTAYLSPSNFTNPIKLTMNKYYQMLSPNLYKKNRYFFAETELFSDKGLIFSESDRMSFIALDNSNNDIDYKSDEDMMDPSISSSLYAITIYLSKNHNKYSLAYMKLQDLAAQVGGIIQILMIICQLLNYNVNSFSRDLDIINSLFELEKPDINLTKLLDLEKSTIGQLIKQRITSKDNA